MKVNDEILKLVIIKSLENSQSLMDDADVLRESNRYQRAYALYQFSMEEVGKAIASVLLLIQTEITDEDVKKYKNNFYRHQRKIKQSAGVDKLICLIAFKGKPEDALSFLKSSLSENEKELDELKNKSLYTAIDGDTVKTPLEMIGVEKMNYIWYRAKSRYTAAKGFVDITLRNYQELRNYQRENGSLKDKYFDADSLAKEFWNDIM